MAAFADDVAPIVVVKDIKELESYRVPAREVIPGWLPHHGLNLAAEKAEAVVTACS